MSAPGAAAPRATLELRVRIWGMGANDQPFFQNATAQNISITGACINGIEQELKVGDVVGVQYETRKARCKVIWIVNVGGAQKIQVGVQLVTDQECPWFAALPPEIPQSAEASRSPDNRRLFARHKVPFPLEFRDERVNTPMRVNATDISGSGCYVETVMPLALGTSLRVEFWVNEERITTSAVVRTRDPGVGMGVEFCGMTQDSKDRFQIYLDKLDPGAFNTSNSSS